jgi:hypothetical protein
MARFFTYEKISLKNNQNEKSPKYPGIHNNNFSSPVVQLNKENEQSG